MRLSGPQKIGLAAVAMVIVAEGAVWILRPGEEPIEPVTVSETDYFEAAEIERARDFRHGQRLLGIGGLVAQGALLTALALGRPRASRRLLERLEQRPVLGAGAAGAGLSVALGAVALPADVWAHERAVDVGLSVQSLDSWFSDVAKSALIGAVFAGVGAMLLIALVRRAPRAWPLPAAGAAVAGAAAVTWLSPVVLAPLFNDFEPLREGSRVRADVVELADRAGVDVGEVYSVDASRRSTALNAYVGGLGDTKRVVLYDTLIDDSERAELRSVVAHELAHVDHDDVPRGILFVALVAPFGLLFAREATNALISRSGAPPGSVRALPAYSLAIGVSVFVLGIAGGQLSRQIEASADTFALRLTDEPQALINLQQRLVRSNISDPDPPDVGTFLFGTHPPAVERIGTALAYESNRRDSAAPGAGG